MALHTAESKNFPALPKLRGDFLLLLSMFALIIAGLLALYSEGNGEAGGGVFTKQVLFAALGLVPLVVFWWVPVVFWQRSWKLLYGLNLLLLLFVMLKGSEGGGAVRWIQLGFFQFQPSEVSKLLTVLTLSSFLVSRGERLLEFSTFLWGVLHVLPPMILIFLQPHLGATMVIFFAMFSVMLVAGVRWQYLLALVTTAVLFLALAVTVLPGVLKGYQKGRIEAMRQVDAQGSGLQQLRGLTAFAAGGVLGTGFLKGELKKGNYVPEQRTDFVLTVIGEEGGFIGTMLVLGAFALLFLRGWLVMLSSQDIFSRCLAIGVLAVLTFHTVANLFMVVRLGPVVGLWLPFLSSGGTALWLCMACVGLLLNLSANRQGSMFESSTL